mgnify:FL=1
MHEGSSNFIDIIFSPAEKSITVPQMTLNMKVNRWVSIKQIIAVIKNKLFIEKESAMYIYKDNKIL